YIRYFFEYSGDTPDVEWLDDARFGACPLRENKGRPTLRFHVFGQLKYLCNRLLRVFAVDISRTAMAQVEGYARYALCQFDLGNKFTLVFTQKENQRWDIIHALMVGNE